MRYILTAVILFCTLCLAQTTNTPAPRPRTEAAPAQAQAALAILEGMVSDSTGAVLVGATVTAKDAAGASKSATTNDQGQFVIRDLAPGPYTITAVATNFKEFKTEGFNVALGHQNYLEVLLQPAGEVTQTEVTGQTTTQIETEKSELSGTITQKQVVTFGLNGRNFTQLLTLTPGVSNQTGQDEAKVGVVGSAKYSVNGGRVEYNTFDVDGSDVLNTGIAASRGHSTLIVYPSLDAIEELKVLTSNYGAQYGRSASGTVLVTTKSGAGQFHGVAYEFLRNEMFNSRGFKDPPGKAPLYRRNDFGATLGGPLYIPQVFNTKKDKVFFFFSEEFRLERSPSTFNQAVPSQNEREGNFSDVCPAVVLGNQADFDRTKYPDCPVKGGSTSNSTYAGNIVPIDPNARAVLHSNVIPVANSPDGCTFKLNANAVTYDPATWPCYITTVSPNTYWRQELFRIDYNASPNLKTSFRYIHDAWDTTVSTPQWQYGGVQNSFPTVMNRFIGPGLSLVAHVVAIKGSTLVNDYSVSFTRDHITLTDVAGPGADLTRPSTLDAACGTTLSSCGIGYLFPNAGKKIPGIYLGGSNASMGGVGFLADTSYMPWAHSNPTISVSDNLTKIMGKHSFQTGILLVDSQQTEVSSATGANTGNVQGLLSFGNVSNPSSTGNTFADFLALGASSNNKIRSFQQDSAQHSYTNRYWIVEPYLQDDWRVTRHLILNLGVRFSMFGNWTPDAGSPVYNFVPSKYDFNLARTLQVDPLYGYLRDATTGLTIPINLQQPDPRTINGLVQCGANGTQASCMSSHMFNPAPRIGFAWDPTGDGKTSIRAGYGMFLEHGTGSEANSGSLIGSAPMVLSMTQTGGWQGLAGTTQVEGFSWECIGGRGLNCGNGRMPVGAAFPLDVVAIPTKVQWPSVQQWSLSVQRELAKDTVATIAYVGSKGTHLTTVRQLNQYAPVDPKDNYFGPHEPVYYMYGPTDAGVCDAFTPSGSSNLQGYMVRNGHIYLPGDPGYFNIQVACSATNVNAYRKYPGYDRVLSIENIANSSYSALQFTLRHISRSISLGVSYTYGHSIDEASDRYESSLGNSLDPHSNRASSNFDQRHMININYVYKLPLLHLAEKLRDFVVCKETDTDPQCASRSPLAPYSGPSKLVRAMFDGWELSGITTGQTGTPFSVINGGSSLMSVLDNAGVANGLGAGSYPDVASGVGIGCDKSAKGIGPLLVNPCRFVAPRGLTFGNAGRNYLNNPDRLNFDVAFARHFTVLNERSLEFRAELFNFFNHSQYRIYNPDKGNTASNTINCYGDATTDYSAGAPSCVAGSSFLHPVDAHRPRTVQFGLKMTF